jgi:hypothetical protein
MTNSGHQPFVNREQFRLNEAVTELMPVIRQIEYQPPTRLHLRKGEALGLVRIRPSGAPPFNVSFSPQTAHS